MKEDLPNNKTPQHPPKQIPPFDNPKRGSKNHEQATGAENKPNDNEQEQLRRWIMAIATVVVAIGTIRLVDITDRYTQAAENQVLETKRGLDQSSDQFDEIRKQARLENRAWVGFYEFDVLTKDPHTGEWGGSRPPQDGQSFKVKYTLVNTGKTPALSVRGRSGLYTAPIDVVPPEPNWSSIRMDTTAILFPGIRTINEGSTGALQAKSGEKGFLWVKVSYCDIFDRRHWTIIGFDYSFETDLFTQRISDVDTAKKIPHPNCLP